MDTIKLLKLYKESLKSGIIDNNILLYLINDEIEKNEYQDYIKEISFKEKDNINGYYHPKMKKIYINTNFIKINCSSIEILVKSKYHILMNTIYHELTHVGQYKNYKENLIKYRDKIKKSDFINVFKAKLYNIENHIEYDNYIKNHDYFPKEHEAYFNSVYITFSKEKEYGLIDLNTSICNKELREKLFKDYELSYNFILSPFDHLKKYLSIDEYNFIAKNKILSDYEKLIMGLPIEHDRFLYIKNILDNSSNFNDGIKKVKQLSSK